MIPRILFRMGLCASLLLTAATLNASPSYRFAFDKTDYQVAAGSTVDVKVYLVETVDDGPSVLDANGAGMFGSGVMLQAVAPLPVDPSTLLSLSDIVPNDAFNDIASGRQTIANEPVITGMMSQVTDFFSYVHADDSEPGLSEYFMSIGTFRFTAGSSSGSVRIQTFTHPLGDVNITGNLDALDGRIANAAMTITTVVPEPSTFWLIGIAGFGLLGYTWQTRK